MPSRRIPGNKRTKAGIYRNDIAYAKWPSHGQLNTTLSISSSRPMVIPAIDTYISDRLEFLSSVNMVGNIVFIMGQVETIRVKNETPVQMCNFV